MHKYNFDGVLDQTTTQLKVYNRTTQALIKDCVNEATHATIFAYGATGSGKTFTMLGAVQRKLKEMNVDQNPHYGIIPRAVSDVFELVQQKNRLFKEQFSLGLIGEKYRLAVSVTYLEVYNENIFDLLTKEGVQGSRKRRGLIPCEDPVDNSVRVLGLTEKQATSCSQVMEMVAYGSALRKTNATAANQHSSRSHAILTLNIHYMKENEVKKVTRLSLIDLAGSERANRTLNTGSQLREGANINKSLLALANCINSLSANSANSAASASKGTSGKEVGVKYRDSKLTHLLKGSLSGNCHVVMIACISPSEKVYEETQNTLKYAIRAKTIKISHGRDGLLSSASAAYSCYSLSTESVSSSTKSVLSGVSKDTRSRRRRLTTLMTNRSAANVQEKQMSRPLNAQKTRQPTNSQKGIEAVETETTMSKLRRVEQERAAFARIAALLILSRNTDSCEEETTRLIAQSVQRTIGTFPPFLLVLFTTCCSGSKRLERPE